VDLYIHSPDTPSWRGAQLKRRGNFTFTFCLLHPFQFTTDILSSTLHEGVSKSFRTESITKYRYTLTTVNTRWEATQRVMAAKLTRLIHKIATEPGGRELYHLQFSLSPETSG